MTVTYNCQRHGIQTGDRVGVRRSGKRYCKDCAALAVRRSYRRKLGLAPDAELRPGAKRANIGDTHIKGGYVAVKVGDDASAHHRASEFGWVLQHLLVAEEKYGFPITKDFTVHHRNANRTDNRPENLELRVGPHGKGGDLLRTLLADEDNRMEARLILAEYDQVRTA